MSISYFSVLCRDLEHTCTYREGLSIIHSSEGTRKRNTPACLYTLGSDATAATYYIPPIMQNLQTTIRLPARPVDSTCSVILLREHKTLVRRPSPDKSNNARGQPCRRTRPMGCYPASSTYALRPLQMPFIGLDINMSADARMFSARPG